VLSGIDDEKAKTGCSKQSMADSYAFRRLLFAENERKQDHSQNGREREKADDGVEYLIQVLGGGRANRE